MMAMQVQAAENTPTSTSLLSLTRMAEPIATCQNPGPTIQAVMNFAIFVTSLPIMRIGIAHQKPPGHIRIQVSLIISMMAMLMTMDTLQTLAGPIRIRQMCLIISRKMTIPMMMDTH